MSGHISCIVNLEFLIANKKTKYEKDFPCDDTGRQQHGPVRTNNSNNKPYHTNESDHITGIANNKSNKPYHKTNYVAGKFTIHNGANYYVTNRYNAFYKRANLKWQCNQFYYRPDEDNNQPCYQQWQFE